MNSKKTVLVIEDNENNWMAAKTSLRKHCECCWANTAQKALEFLNNQKPHIILMDINLPDMSGLELTQKLREEESTKDLIIFAFTAAILPEQKKAAIKAGCNGIIAKPFTRDELLKALSPFLK